MITILDHQNANTNGRDILVVNGEMSEYRGTEEQKRARGLIMPDSEMQKQKLFSWYFRMKGSSPNFCLYFNKRKGVIMTSNLFSKDEIGRRLSYTYYCDKIDDPVFIRKLFEDYCSIASVIPDPKDTKALESFLRFNKNKKKIVAIGIAVLVALLFIIFNL